MRPFPLLEPCGCEDKAGDLVSQHTQPDADDSEAEHIAAQIGGYRTDKRDADGGGNRCVECVSRTAQAAHIYDLADLESDYENNDPHNSDAQPDDMFFFEKEAH